MGDECGCDDGAETRGDDDGDVTTTGDEDDKAAGIAVLQSD